MCPLTSFRYLYSYSTVITYKEDVAGLKDFLEKIYLVIGKSLLQIIILQVFL